MNDLDGTMGERARLWRLGDPGEPELLRATYRTRTFSRHAHERFAIGVIEAGGLAFRYRGEEVVAPAGWVNLAFPGEPHSGRSLGPEGWSYRMFYLDPAHLAALGEVRELPFVAAGAVWDPDLARCVSDLHRLCEDPGSEPLAREVLLMDLARRLLARHASERPRLRTTPFHPGVRTARAMIDDLAVERLSLEALAAAAGMSPCALVRSFTREVGLPPHAYQVQARLQRAAALLRQGIAPARAAAETGFADQSHLHRHFVKAYGLAPGAYRRAHVPRG